MTGSDLLDSNQAYFTFAGVAMSFERAEDVVRRLLRDHRLQGNELKGKNLVKSGSGRRAIASLISEAREEVHLVVHHKKYSLACKYFEYTFEPVLASQNSIFYEAGFHRFIANLLYAWSLAQDRTAEELLTDFATFMRTRDPERMPAFFGKQSIVLAAGSDPLSHIGTFCLLHQKKIADEIKDLEGPLGTWILDLTSTSLFSVLSYWGDRYHQLDVFCDHAKPLERQDVFDAMINREDRAYQTMGGVERLLTFNLARSPQLVKSEEYFGVQVADVFASSLRHAVQNRQDQEAQTWLKELLPSVSNESVWYDLSTLDLDTPEAFANAIVLHELVNRSLRREDLFDGMPQLIATARDDFPKFQQLQAGRHLEITP